MLFYRVSIDPQENLLQFLTVHFGIIVHPIHIFDKRGFLLFRIMPCIGFRAAPQIMGNVVVGMEIEVGVYAAVHQLGYMLVELARRAVVQSV